MESTPSFTLQTLAPIRRVRRNHALEHATMHVLSERSRELKLVGRSTLWGFYIYGDVPTKVLLAAVQEGLRRLRGGDWQAAIHPNCGSNLVVAGLLGGFSAFLAFAIRPEKSWWKRLTRLPLASVGAMLGIILSRPLGALLQAHVTTEPAVGDMRIVDVTRQQRGGVIVHHVRTEG